MFVLSEKDIWAPGFENRGFFVLGGSYAVTVLI